MSRTLYHNEEDQEKVNETVRKLYLYIGKCTTRYQSVEDNLPNTFARAFSGSEDVASEIFEIARGLEDKLRMISAAMGGRNAQLKALWDELRPRIKSAFDRRNQIAHGTPVQAGRGIVLEFDKASDEARFVGYLSEHSELKLEKKNKNAVITWTHDQLREMHEDFDTVWLNLVTLDKMLVDEAIPKHWADCWTNDVVLSWPTK